MKSTLKICLIAIGLAISTLTGAAELGRLFFSPEQRAQLDYNYAQAAAVGQDNALVYGEWLGYGSARVERLEADGII